jgi:PAS domain S-box-containing protein
LAFQPAVDGLGDFEVLSKDAERTLMRGWRAGNERAGPVLVVVPSAAYPPPAFFSRLVHEYDLREELEPAAAARPSELLRQGDRPVLLLEDPGGEPLEPLVGAPMEPERFLRFAIGIAAALAKVHERRLVHKDVKPANILVHCADGLTRFTGFGIASRLPRERAAPNPPETIDGSLEYMAPEQTGRMNRSVDSRSDLYALGITFYRMLTGDLPFTAADPMEWVHCHVARKPEAPHERRRTTPAVLSDIVMKLLAKPAEERYQTAAGLEHDLKRSLLEWERRGLIEPFPLGERDTPDRLLIPEKLYGREREVESLVAAFDLMVKRGATELVLVSGSSGIGKSSVVNELHRALVPPRGLFAAGKFEQYKRDIPYSTLAQAFQSLVRMVLTKSNAELSTWRETLRDALGANGRMIADLVPELELVIGAQPPVAELEPQHAKAKFQLTLRRFISVFARPEHPLVLFLDDLQWLDAATLDLIEDMLTQADVGYLMLIGAYRYNEVDATHPIAGRLAAIRNSPGRVSEINLGPLDQGRLTHLIADTLHARPEDVASLARLVHAKTAGNPFFVIQFLHSLTAESLLSFDHEAACWTWDLNRIGAKGYADNVADLMAGSLARLPDETRKALQQLSCVGAVADVSTLAIALETSPDEVHAALWQALRAELIERLPNAYRFAHDRVQEAAYSLIPEEGRAAAHLRLGRLLIAQTAPEKRDEAIFDIVHHLNRGAALIASRAERKRLAELNLIAGKRAHASGAHGSALAYFATGRALLPESPWRTLYELAFELERLRAECEFFTGELSAAEKRLSFLSRLARDARDRALIACQRMKLLAATDRREESVEIGLDYLRSLGGVWSPHPSTQETEEQYRRLWDLVGARTISSLIDIPVMQDPLAQAKMDVLATLSEPAFFTDENLPRLIVAQMANVSLEQGNTDASCLAYVWLGKLLGTRFDRDNASFEFGRLGVALMERRGLQRFRARVYHEYSHVFNPWMTHPRERTALLRRAFDVSNEIGDLTCAGYSASASISAMLAAGEPLRDIQREAERMLDFSKSIRFTAIADSMTGQLGLILALRGVKSGFDECRFERQLEQRQKDGTVELAWLLIRRLQCLFFAGDHLGAALAARRVEPLLWWAVPSQLAVTEYHFYAALARVAASETASGEERSVLVEALKVDRVCLEYWATIRLENLQSQAALVTAEIARVEGRPLDAERLYEEAIRSAGASGLVHIEALANELAAHFYAGRGFEKIARIYLRDARYGYLRWGADSKVRQLEERYPDLWVQESAPGPTGTIGASVERLDLATVIKVSQAVSSELVLEKLIDTLMRTALEQAGAERGLLIVPRADGLGIEAEAAIANDAILVRLRDEPATAQTQPLAILQYVLRTQESVILADASAQNPFSADSYLLQHKSRSILCMPLINLGKLIGVLYLENNLAPSVFAPARNTVLKLLASQAAIALENTRLYRNLEQRESKIRALFDSNIIGIFIRNADGEVSEANDAFLNLLGYDREDLASGHIHRANLVPPDWSGRDAQAFAEASTRGTVEAFEKEYLRKDGRRVPVLIGAALLERDRIVAFVLDLTDRKRAEAEVRESQERSHAMQIQLEHANRLATMGQLTASIAHEILHPIATARNNARAAARFLEMKPPDLAEVRDALNCVVRDADRARDIVDRIRGHMKRGPSRRDLFDLSEAINEVVVMVRSALDKNKVVVRTRLMKPSGSVRGDRVQLQQVILNLILNAMEAMSSAKGARELSIETEQSETDGVRVAVRDSGLGLGREHFEQVFQPFYTTKGDGLGMGLAICRSIIESHGGRLWVEKNEPRGAAFWFTLPGRKKTHVLS